MASIPLSTYDRYQRAASFFLDWLIRAHGHGHPSADRIDLEVLSSTVKEIATDPSSLSQKLLQELPKALAACKCALKLSSRASSLTTRTRFPPLLGAWHRTLENSVKSSKSAGNEYFADEESFVLDVKTPKSVKTALKRVCAEAFADDLALDLVLFVSELEELVTGVYQIYVGVTAEIYSMIEATVVAKLAMDTASDLTTRFQQRRPEIRAMQDLIEAVGVHAPRLYAQTIKSVDAIQQTFDREGTYTFSPFELIRDFELIWITLMCFTTGLPSNMRTGFIFTPSDKERYGEERTPSYVLPNTDMSNFVMENLSLLYNINFEKKEVTGSGFDRSRLEGAFMGLMNDYFASHQVTIPLVFAWTCWVKAVAALQGDGGLCCNISVTLKHARDLTQHMHSVVSRPTILDVRRPDTSSNGSLPNFSFLLQRTNPFMAGFIVLDMHFSCLRVGHACLPSVPIFRAFGHLYNALVGQEFLEPIPFLEEVLELYEQLIFTPSRAAAVRGAYDRTYLYDSGYFSASRKNVISPGDQWTDEDKAEGLREVSKIWRFLSENDSSDFRGANLVEMLYDAAETCWSELFETRVLSRDVMPIVYDITDVFSELCDELGQRQVYKKHIKNGGSRGTVKERAIEALENAAMYPLLPLLDALQPDGSLDFDVLPPAISSESTWSAEKVCGMAKKAAAVINAKFAVPPSEVERRYFTFPSQPDFVTKEYGTESFKARRSVKVAIKYSRI